MIGLVHVVTVPDSLLFLKGQIAFMKERGYDVSVVSSPGDRLDRFGRDEQIAVYPLEMPRRITPARDLLSVARLALLLRKIRPRIVHAHTPKGGLLGMLAARSARIPVRIYHMRGLPLMTATGWKRQLLTQTERVSCGLSTKVLSVSHSLRRFALDARLCAPEKIDVLLAGSGNGVDATGRFNPALVGPGARASMRRVWNVPGDAIVFGYVGRLVRDKGIVELAEAWRTVRAALPSTHLIVTGVFEPRDPVPGLTRQTLERDPRVAFIGFREDMPEVYSAFDVLVLPSYREGFPNTPLEAAAMALPVVTTNVPGCVDSVLDGVTGAVVQVRDAKSLAEAMRRYGDAALRRDHGAAGRARVEREFQREKLWTALAATYEGALGQAAVDNADGRSAA